MSILLATAAAALLAGIAVLSGLARHRGQAALTVADLAVLLSCAELARVLHAIGQAGLPPQVGDPLTMLCLAGLVLAAVRPLAGWIGPTVISLGAAAALTDVQLTLGGETAAALVAVLVLVWLANQLVRLLPRR